MKFIILNLLGLIIISKTMNAQNQGYKILSINEINEIEKKRILEIDTSYILEYNGGFVTIFKDNTALIRPPVLGGSEGLLFDNVESMKIMIESKVYPVKGTNTFWENEKVRVFNFKDEMNYYSSKLSEILNFDVKINTESLYLNSFSNAITNYLKKKKKNTLVKKYTSIIISEMIRKEVGGEWALLPNMALNLYYMPEIKVNDKYCNPWKGIENQLEMANFISLDIKKLIDKESLFYPIGNRKYKDL